LTWFEQSRKLLNATCTPWGIKASLTNTTNYGAIFTRDAIMVGIIGLFLKDIIIIEGFKKTLFNLKELQGKQGQIASNFKVVNETITEVSYGTLSPKIDACTWYLIGIGLLIKEGILEKEDYNKSIEKTITLLEALEYNGKHLIYIPKGGNWADENIYEGYILYDQILRAWGLKLLASVYGKKLWLNKAQSILKCIDEKYMVEKSKFYDSSIYPGGSFKKFDLAAHALAGLVFEEDDQFYKQSLDWIFNQFLNKDKLPPAFHPVIKEGDRDWDTLRNFHLFEFKNKPHHYHNGGIWWIWLGWLAISLSLYNEKNALDQLLKIAFNYLDSLEEFDFEEYVSADELKPCGTQKLGYTATGIAMLCLAKNGFDFSSLKR